MAEFKILRGLRSSLDSLSADKKVEGYWYITLDTHELFTCIDGEIVKLNECDIESFDPTEINNRLDTIESRLDNLAAPLERVATRGDLPIVGDESIVYFTVSDGCTLLWDTTVNDYVCVGTSATGMDDVKIIYGGCATV